jgi:hypothetical protein
LVMELGGRFSSRSSSFLDFRNSTFSSVRLISCTQNEHPQILKYILKHIVSNRHFQPKNALPFNYYSTPTTKSREKVEGKNWEGSRLPAPKKTKHFLLSYSVGWGLVLQKL